MRELIVKKDYPIKEKPEPETSDLLEGSIVVINKPKGPFSYQVTDRVKQVLKVKKTGHAGTLDPNATGVLPIGVNKGCHLLRVISKAPKEYEGVMHLHQKALLSSVIEASKEFIGTITQLPPVRSAVKREEREREIYDLEVKDFKGRDVFFRVKCQAGTYIRKLVSEWGESMSVTAHLKDLTRTLAGPYSLKDAVRLEAFLEKPRDYLKPLETAVTHLCYVWLDDNTVESISHGSQPFLPGVIKYHEGINQGEFIALMSSTNELVAIAKSLMTAEEMSGSRGQVAKLERVFI